MWSEDGFGELVSKEEGDEDKGGVGGMLGALCMRVDLEYHTSYVML